MTALLCKLFIRNADNPRDPRVRSAYATLTSAVGIILNLLLFAGKFLAGTLAHSVAICADAMNNLSDAGSQVHFNAMRKIAAEHPSEVVGKDIRKLYSWADEEKFINN